MTSSIRVVFVSTAIASILALVVVMAVVAAARPTVYVASPAASSTTALVQPGVITSGDATVSKKPDSASLSVGVESRQSTASAAQSDLANKAAKLIARAKALGIADKDLNTSGYSVGPYYAPGAQTISGYQASEQLQLNWHTVDTVGKALDALVQEGGATNVSVSFGLADPKAAQAEARTLAIADARSRAQAMAGAAGVKLGQVMRVSDLTASGYPSAGYAINAAAPAASQLPVGELNVTVTVEVDFAIG
ncbi:MAG TPA: SIMPL domain-containing protein [Candidatus Dormibacteraeota bacterium]